MIQGSSLSLSDGLELERVLDDYLMATEDFDEGCKAFIEKRKPVFKGK